MHITNSDQTPFPVEIAPEAISQLHNLLKRKGKEGSFIRLGVKGGGCSGLEYVLKIDDQRLPNDLQLTPNDLLIACDPKSAKFLKGSKLIYTGNLMGGGFEFQNPNAQRSCGCGTSFTPKS